jgi:hypothetical protein
VVDHEVRRGEEHATNARHHAIALGNAYDRNLLNVGLGLNQSGCCNVAFSKKKLIVGDRDSGCIVNCDCKITTVCAALLLAHGTSQ